MGNRRLPIPERADWHQSSRGLWSLSLGVRGLSVRVTQRCPGGVFSRIFWDSAGSKWRYESLRTTTRAEARRLAEEFLRQVAEGETTTVVTEPLTLERLWTLYQKEAPGYKQNTSRTQTQKEACMKRLLAGLGKTKLVELLTLNDVERFTGMRRTGLGWSDGKGRNPVRTNAIRHDLGLLRTVILWATRERQADGSWLLKDNPLRGMRIPREDNPRRPVADYDRFLKIRAAAQELATTAPQERGRERWRRFELALVIAEATGRRIGAILGLRWSDISFDEAAIRWRAEHDKRRRDQVVPVPLELVEEMRRFRVQLKSIGDGYVFPRVMDDRPWAREVFRELLIRAEQHAEVAHVRGGAWHPYRRKWATERGDMPVKALMVAGGWKDLQTLVNYQQPTEETILQVMSHPVKLRSRKASSSS